MHRASRAFAAALLLATAVACTRAVPGTPVAVADPVPAGDPPAAASPAEPLDPARPPAPAGLPEPDAAPDGTGPDGAVTDGAVRDGAVTPPADGTPEPAADRPELTADVLADECLLDAAQFAALVGRAVREPEQLAVRRDDGTVGNACYAHASEGSATPLAAVNVYATRSGSPVDVVRAAPPGGRRVLDGLGEAAAVLDTLTGPTLQVASRRYLVTIVVLDRLPGDDAWRAAGLAALARLPG